MADYKQFSPIISTVLTRDGKILYRAHSDESMRFAGDGPVISGLHYSESDAFADWRERCEQQDNA